MRQLLVLLILLCCTAFAQTKDDCINVGLKILKKNYPRGIQILNRLSAEKRKETERIMHCDKNRSTLIISLETVVHEAVHFLDSQLSIGTGQAFYLTNDSLIVLDLPEHILDAIGPKHINQIYNTISDVEQTGGAAYGQTYLQGDIGNQDFFTLMDELNAYTNGLDAAIQLPKLSGGTSTASLTGPLAMTAFILRYYEYFEKNDADYFQHVLMSKELLPAVKILIDRALAKVKEGRSIPDLQFDVETWEQVLQSDEHKRMMKVISR